MFPIDITSSEWTKIEKLSVPKDVVNDVWQHKLAILNCEDLKKLNEDCIQVAAELDDPFSTLNVILTNKLLKHKQALRLLKKECI